MMKSVGKVRRFGDKTLLFCGVSFELIDAESCTHFLTKLEESCAIGKVSHTYSVLCELHEAVSNKISFKDLRPAFRSKRMSRRRAQGNPGPSSAEGVVGSIQAAAVPFQPVDAVEEEIPFDIPVDEEFKRDDIYVPM